MTALKDKTIAVLVVSCDNYSDLWKPFFECFRRFWPDCPYPVYLVNNHKEVEYSNVTAIHVGDDVSWSDNLQKALGQVPHEYVFIYIEDLFLKTAVDSQKVQAIFRWAIENKADYVKMIHGSHKIKTPYNDLVNEIPKGSLYRASLVMCLFKKAVLLDLLRPGENAWEFEMHGTERSDKYDRFYSTRDKHFDTINTIIKRKWQRDAVRAMQQLNIDIDLSARAVMNCWEGIKYKMLILRTGIFNLVPSSYKRSLKKLLGGGKYK